MKLQAKGQKHEISLLENRGIDTAFVASVDSPPWRSAMTEISNDDIDHFEGMSPTLAASATHAAYLRAVDAGFTLVIAKNGWLVRRDPDGSVTQLRALHVKHKVVPGSVFYLSSTLRS
mgnify:CR=1 FL=1